MEIIRVIEKSDKFLFVHKTMESSLEQRTQLIDQGIYSIISTVEKDWTVVVQKKEILEGFLKEWDRRIESEVIK